LAPKDLGRIRTQSLADQARDRIRQAIFEGRMQPAERLTIERIAAEFGISRTPVREALKALETDGIVRILPHRGAIVERFDEAELHDRYSVRALLEGYAAERACRNQSPVLAATLAARCRALEEAAARTAPDDLDAVRVLVELNADFHDEILRASGSTTAIRQLAALTMPLAYRLYHWRVPDRRQVSIDCHRRIVQAFAKRRPKEARRLLEEHVLEARDFLAGRR
jgi:DNA-binding GntR family transcriptional regulator